VKQNWHRKEDNIGKYTQSEVKTKPQNQEPKGNGKGKRKRGT
jgi:hypothetical protein